MDSDFKDGALISDYSVGVGDIDENLEPQVIRRIIRDTYLRDSEVTVLLSGLETRYRKHVDWELKSSMIDGKVNGRSGIVVIDLPSSGSTSWHAAFPDEKKAIYADYEGPWTTISTKTEYENRYPNMPGRIIENLLKDDVKIPIVPWDRIYGYPERLSYLLAQAAIVGRLC
ncbi:MAG: hypothetical protein GKR99_02080 [Rhodobacteraceae bacterium]|nr:hypothetical protein [Paracoccaceae bacterium]